MSRPRKPFGRDQPGRLPSTMMKVLAAEMADPERLRRGKRMAKDGSVLDIVIEPGAVVCEVQGSRATPYVATLRVEFGDGMPLRRNVDGHCTCPDADNLWGTASGGSDICKHVVASMMVFADELLIEPTLLDVWRNSAPSADQNRDAPDPPADQGDEPDQPPPPRRRPSEHPALARRHLRVVGGTEYRERSAEPPAESLAEPSAEPPGDRLAELLAAPAGSTLPAVGHLDRMEPVVPPRRDLAAVIRDAVEHLRIDWD